MEVYFFLLSRTKPGKNFVKNSFCLAQENLIYKNKECEGDGMWTQVCMSDPNFDALPTWLHPIFA